MKLLKARQQKRFSLGTVHRALLIRSKVNYNRFNNIYIKFDENSVVLITRNTVPVTNRIYGPVLKEFCMRWPSVGCVTACMI